MQNQLNLSSTYKRLVFLLMLCLLPGSLRAAAPAVLLAENYQSGVDVSQYLISEKFDGVRAIWDGKTLVTRQGNTINAPSWFTQNLPKIAMDGELWLARGQFDALSGAVRKDTPIDAEWRKITYQIFELPNTNSTFEARAKRIVEIVNKAHQENKAPHLKAVKQFKLADEKALKTQLIKTVKNGGEGLMLHLASAEYTTGRSAVLLKLKPLYDAEAMVIAHTAGKGKFVGMLGALVVKTPDGITFKLGTGLSDAQRESPPPIGSLVTYTFRDTTKNGKPKFACFLRVRNEK